MTANVHKKSIEAILDKADEAIAPGNRRSRAIERP
jgi:hypothetical protein